MICCEVLWQPCRSMLSEMEALLSKCHHYWEASSSADRWIFVVFSLHRKVMISNRVKLTVEQYLIPCFHFQFPFSLAGAVSCLMSALCCSSCSLHPGAGVVPPGWVCITLQIGRVVAVTDSGTSMCGLCHYCPLPLFLCGLWLVAWHSASSSVVQLADSDSVVLMTHCFAWGHPQQDFFPPMFSIISHVGILALGQWTFTESRRGFSFVQVTIMPRVVELWKLDL